MAWTACYRWCRCRPECRSGTLAIGRAGAVNAALLAASILALSDTGIAAKLAAYRAAQAGAPEDPRDEG